MKPFRLRFSFRDRIALLLIFLCALGFGWIANSARKQRQAIVEVKKYGGFIAYDYEVDDKAVHPRKSWVPAGILKHFGPDYFHRVASVTYIDQPPSDATLAPLEILTDITRLEWRLHTPPKAPPVVPPKGSEKLTAKGLSRLGKLRRLREISVDFDKQQISGFSLKALIGSPLLQSIVLSGTALTDAEMPPLDAFPRLKVLAFSGGNKITGECLAPLSKITGFEALGIDNEPISLAAYAHIAAITKLKALQISGPTLDDKQLANLARLKHLTDLVLGSHSTEGKFGDDGLAIVQNMPGLKSLTLASPKITDAGLRSLRQLWNLEWLVVDCPMVSGEALVDLKKTLPRLYYATRW